MAKRKTNRSDADTLPPFVAFVLAEAHVRAIPRGTVQACRDGSFRCEWRTVPTYNLIYVTHGRAVWRFEHHEQPLRAGDLLIVTPGEAHEGLAQTRHMRLISMHAEVLLPDGSDAIEQLAPPPVRPVSPDGLLHRYFEGYAAELNDRPNETRQRFVLPWIRLAFMVLINSDALADRLQPATQAPWITQVLETLNQDLTRTPALDDLAHRFGYSAQHLNRRFKQVLGLTPLQFHQRARMRQAAALLDDGAMSVAAVAQRLGYDDPYYFSRQFKQVMGQSPTDYREASERMV